MVRRREAPDHARTRPLPTPCDANGLALSGGGVRSAAFCLGALQALEAHSALPDIDYLSTVSGGGYVGTSLAAAISRNGGQFPFATGTGDIRDSDSVGHFRNFSNYLMPRGRSFLANAGDVFAVLTRGVLANALVVLPYILIAALATAVAVPKLNPLGQESFFTRLLSHVPVLSGNDGLIALFMVAVVAFVTTLTRAQRGTLSIEAGVTAVILVALPYALLFSRVQLPQLRGPFGLSLWLAGVFAFSLVLWALSRSSHLIHQDDAGSWNLTFCRILAWITLLSFVLDLIPLALELLFLLSAPPPVSPSTQVPGQWFDLTAMQGLGLLAILVSIWTLAGSAERLAGAFSTAKRRSGFRALAAKVGAWLGLLFVASIVPLILVSAYLLISLALITAPDEAILIGFGARQLTILVAITGFVITWYFDSNAYSLHQFYRDRLEAAFLAPQVVGGSNSAAGNASPIKLSDIDTTQAPYLLVNAALNVQGSAEANRRGRNADFFAFTPHFVGCDLTLYAPTNIPLRALTVDMQTVDPRLDLAAAMAISGAAASSNMGSNTIRVLSPTLAFLNVRLGYWLRNPRALGPQAAPSVKEYLNNLRSNLYLLAEMLGLLDETSEYIYLTDGGHIENLGIYELLKRGCQLIVAVDAEADPTLSFSSLLKLERYARIDLGVRIDLPWEEIRTTNDRVSYYAEHRRRPEHNRGPHCAVGRIRYPGGQDGVLLYIKSSLTGDERDYILDYKVRHPNFPHESTGDQFFTEEQFEVYRALGFHALESFFAARDDVSFWTQSTPGSIWYSKDTVVNAMRQMLPSTNFEPLS
jgi:hypothetical protein